MPRAFLTAHRKALEMAAGTCPFKRSFRPETEFPHAAATRLGDSAGRHFKPIAS